MGGCYTQVQHSPCANCGKRPGSMGASRWAFEGFVCSTACGERLDRKIRGGMVEPEPEWPEQRVRALRLENKILRGRLRQLGAK